jgi:hypothetical protein
MFKHKNVFISLAVAALLAACGGGSDSTPAATTASASTATTAKPAATTPAATTPAATTPAATPPAANPPAAVTVDNTMMSGDLQLASGELLVNGQQLPYSAFVDPGATSNGLYGFQTLSTFGLRVKPENFAVSPTNESKTVRLGFELLDKSTAGTKETLQIIIDKVTVTFVAATGDLTVSIPADAKMYAYAKNVSGTANATVTTVPANLVSLTAIPGDTTSKALTLDVAGAITAAKTAAAANAAVFNAVNDYTDRLTLNMTISNIALKSAATPPVALAAGKDIAVTGSGQPSILNGDAAAKAAAASISGTVCGGCNAGTTP